MLRRLGKSITKSNTAIVDFKLIVSELSIINLIFSNK